MALRRLLRRNPWIIVALGCLLVIVVILDAGRRTGEFQKHHERYHGSKHKPEITIVYQNQTKKGRCDKNTVILSTKLDIRLPWRSDPKCAHHSISHMIPKCRSPVALASFPGSGNTWLRHMLEGASGIFTGSRYKDLQIQMFGLWGEIRRWNDGTTIVQKTHDASEHHVLKDFDGKGVLIVRNPYDAILSAHNLLYAGHHGTAPIENFRRKDWEHFVTIQTSRWLDMLTNWTIHSSPHKVLVVHYENLKLDTIGELKTLMSHLDLPSPNDERIECLLKFKDGFFKRESSPKSSLQNQNILQAFPKHVRDQMDDLIDDINRNVLRKNGFTEMPLHRYNNYRKSDVELLSYQQGSSRDDIQNKMSSPKFESKSILDAIQNDIEEDKKHGTQMVIDQYLKQTSSDHRDAKDGKKESKKESNLALDLGDKLALGLLKMGTGSGKASNILSAAVEYWPKLQRPFAKDPIDDLIQTDGSRGKEIRQLQIP